MPVYYKPPIKIGTRGIPTYNGAPAEDPTPFRAFLVKGGEDAQVSISRYSAVLNSPDVRDRVTIIGVDAPIDIEYKTRVWLETFFDKNLEPVFSMVNSGLKWEAFTVGTSNRATETEVYPGEIEMITKYDINNKIADLALAVANIRALKNRVTDEINSQKDMGFILAPSAQAILAGIDAGYAEVETLVSDYQAGMNNFFSGAPTATWKKQFRTFTPICYTTKDTNYKLDGIATSPGVPVPASQPTSPTATKDPIYKIVQQLNSDLLLVDICHQNRYPARLPIPYHRPVYNFVIDRNNEDETNTA